MNLCAFEWRDVLQKQKVTLTKREWARRLLLRVFHHLTSGYGALNARAAATVASIRSDV